MCAFHLPFEYVFFSVTGAVSGLELPAGNSLQDWDNSYCSVQEKPYSLKEYKQRSITLLQEGNIL